MSFFKQDYNTKRVIEMASEVANGVHTPKVIVDGFTVGDISIGAVEIKDSSTDTRASVGVNGLAVDVKASALPSGAATSAKQDSLISKVPAALTAGGNLKTAIQEALPSGANIIGKVGVQVAGADVAAGNPVQVQSVGFESSASFTRPDNATPYTALDVVGTDAATNMSFANIGSVAGGHFIITGVQFECDAAAVPAGMDSFRLHLYNAAPTAITDNLAFNIIGADRAKYLGFITINTPIDCGDTLFVNVDQLNFKRKLAAASTTIYGVLQTVSGFTPAAQVVNKITIHGMQC